MADEPEEKKIKRTLSPETHAERKIKSVFTEADTVMCKQFVASITQPGKYFKGKSVKKISAAAAKRLWGDGGEN